MKDNNKITYDTYIIPTCCYYGKRKNKEMEMQRQKQEMVRTKKHATTITYSPFLFVQVTNADQKSSMNPIFCFYSVGEVWKWVFAESFKSSFR